MDGIYWIVPGELAGCPRPGWRALYGLGDPGEGVELARDLAALRGLGITALLSLTEKPLEADHLAAAGITAEHLPVIDFQPPTPNQLQAGLAFIRARHAAGQAVAVHCGAGRGRTGTLLAAYLIARGLEADEAIAEVRRACPPAIETEGQVQALHAFASQRP